MSKLRELQHTGAGEQAADPADRAPELDTAQLIALLVEERRSGLIDAEEYLRRRTLLENNVLERKAPHRTYRARRVGAFVRTLYSLSYIR